MPKRAVKPAAVRSLRKAELLPAARLVSHSMLGSLQDEHVEGWAAAFEDGWIHGAFDESGELAGVARWFPADLSLDGHSVPAAAVTSVAVGTNERRKGHLTRLMNEQLASFEKKQVPIALLVAAEWPIYGRFGYGPAINACSIEIDTQAAEFRDARSGSIELVDAARLRPHLEAIHAQRWARTTGAITRGAWFWDHAAGLKRLPGDTGDPGQNRAALWRDDRGEVQGVVAYAVEQRWTDNRPTGMVRAGLLLGCTPEAERELWRHLCEIDWVSSIRADNRSIEDPLLLMLTDGRAAVKRDEFDCIWARVLDVPRVFSTRRSTLAGGVVVKVDDKLGYASGTWSIEIGPDGADVASTSKKPEVRLSIAALSAASLGGRSLTQMHHAGWLTERSFGAVARLDTLLRSPVAPWSPTTY